MKLSKYASEMVRRNFGGNSSRVSPDIWLMEVFGGKELEVIEGKLVLVLEENHVEEEEVG